MSAVGKWRVWNKHSHGFDHAEMFKGEMVRIPHNKYILMDYEDAVQFKGQYFPMKIAADGTHDPKGFKQLFIEPDGGVSVITKSEEFVSHMDGKKFSSKSELDAHLKANFAGQEFKDEALEEIIAKTEAVVAERKKPGPKPKEKSL